MSGILRLGWWLAAGVIGWTYAGFPAVLLLRARLRPAPVAAADIEPAVSLLIAAHDEAAVIGARLDNALDLDYPTGHLEIIVASDGSTDGTEAIVEGYASRGVKLIALPRSGKAAALEAAVAAATGEILVFSDANSLFEPGALRALVRPFADPAVGGVAGDQRYAADDDRLEGRGERSYWDIDRQLKVAESRAGNAVSATGAIHAIRASLAGPIPRGVTDDFAISTSVIDQGARLVFVPDAVAWERVTPTDADEFARKVRIMTRGLHGVVVRRRLLDPRRSGFYAIQLLTHKLLRRLMFAPLLVLALASPLLWRQGAPYRLATLGQVAAYGLAVTGLVARERPVGRSRPAALASFFVVANAAAARATWNLVRGRRIDRWDPTDRGTDR